MEKNNLKIFEIEGEESLNDMMNKISQEIEEEADKNNWKHRYFENIQPGSFPINKKIQEQVYNSDELYHSVEFLKEWLINWTGIFLHSVYHHFKDVEKYNSIYYCYLESQTYQFEWIIYSLFSGQYDLTMRELRTMIECAFFHYRYDADLTYQNKTIEEKNDIMEITETEHLNETYGKKVFEKSGYLDWSKVYEELYRPLSAYVHTGLGRRNSMALCYNERNGRYIDAEFDLCKITKCLEMIKEVVLLEVELMEMLLQNVYGIPKNNASYKDIFYNIC
jgi:hypothetical protein